MNYIKYTTFVLSILSITVLSSCKKDMSMKMNEPRNIHGIVGFQRTFNDMNDAHLAVAQKYGITPIESTEEAEKMKDQLTELIPNEHFAMDSLTHSIPFLVPRAYNLLDELGTIFIDSLSNKGLNPNQIVVTSVLRTKDDVKRLRKGNGNASLNSAHFYGTTFDVAYARFKKVEDPDGRPMQDVSQDTLKLVLAEVLYDMQKNKKCYIKYEVKQGCFHITAR
ncbi:DUF5715 family protein [Phocaeicola paurosaccharolyticus]|uniref:DUF5715 family protein n=1 Tax=Phocaeicola paurosaccharolyticus TaxID=732242 RepID=UPI00046ABF64|nr:DUF5715 family protein [Phocaeicola paurosaccharolyticus]